MAAAKASLLALLLLSVAAAGQSSRTNEISAESQRLQYFHQARQFPYPAFPAGAQQQAWEQARRKLTVENVARAGAAGGAAADDTTVANVWSEIGPRPLASGTDAGEVSGRVTSIAVDPRNSSWVYLGAADGGVWKTSDGGLHWAPLTDDMPSLAVGSLAIAPSAPDTILAGLGEGYGGYDFYYGMGILKSTDAGAHWRHIPGPFYGPVPQARSSYYGSAHIGALAVKPDDANVVLAGAQMVSVNSGGDRSGIWRSADGGETWSAAPVLAGAPGTDIVFDRLDPQIVYAAIGLASESTWGVYKSRDAGQTWTRINGGTGKLPSSDVGRTALALQHTAGQSAVLYAAVAEDMSFGLGGLMGVYKASDNGTSTINWSRLNAAADFCSPQCSYSLALAVHPDDSKVVYAGGAAGNNSLYRSLDGGSTWSGIRVGSDGLGLHGGQHALEFSPDGAVLYIGNSGGVWKTANTKSAPVTYTNLNHTLGTLQFNPGLALHPTDASVALGGTEDTGLDRYSGNWLWNAAVACDGGWSAIDPTDPSRMYAACQQISPMRSTDGGQTWYPIVGAIPAGEKSLYIPPLVMDPSMPQTLYFGTYRVWQSTDGAAHWTSISGDLSKTPSASVLTALAVAPGKSSVIYAGTLDGNVLVTRNALDGSGNVLWTPRISGLPPRAVSNFAVSPADADVALVTFSGFTWGSDTLGHIFRTTDGGLTWTDISGSGDTGLPNSPANAVVFDPAIAGRLYVATDVGVFSSSDDGATWSTLGVGLPKAAVIDLKLHAPSRTLRAATHGRGVWDLFLPQPGGIAPDDAHLAIRDFRSLSQTEVVGSTQVSPLQNDGSDPQHCRDSRGTVAIPGGAGIARTKTGADAPAATIGTVAPDARHRPTPAPRQSSTGAPATPNQSAAPATQKAQASGS